MFGLIRAWRRRRLSRRPFPAQWTPILIRCVPFFRDLSGERRQRFLDLLKVFVWEKHFVGAGGLEVTDEVRVVIGASAVRLILGLDSSYYDRLTEIVVYPYVYRHPGAEGAVLGEAHTWGVVVLSWPAVLEGLRDPRDGQDTAAHEFAHVLDIGDGAFDGTPELARRSLYEPWARVLSHHFLRLRRQERDQRRVLREYGATNEAEFFAVATEAYFEKPVQMRDRTPDLYAELQRFYGGDPAAGAAVQPAPVPKIGRNDPCPCGSGKKYKRCCRG